MKTLEVIPKTRRRKIYLPKSEKPYHLAQLLYGGVPFPEACDQVGIGTSTGYQWQHRWRQEASKILGRPVSTVGALHCIFAPEKIMSDS